MSLIIAAATLLCLSEAVEVESLPMIEVEGEHYLDREGRPWHCVEYWQGWQLYSTTCKPVGYRGPHEMPTGWIEPKPVTLDTLLQKAEFLCRYAEEPWECAMASKAFRARLQRLSKATPSKAPHGFTRTKATVIVTQPDGTVETRAVPIVWH